MYAGNSKNYRPTEQHCRQLARECVTIMTLMGTVKESVVMLVVCVT